MKRRLQEVKHSISKRTKVASAHFHPDGVPQSNMIQHVQKPKPGSANDEEPKRQAPSVTKFHGMLVDDLLFIES